MDELKHLYKISKEKTDVSLLNKLAATASESETPTKKKMMKDEASSSKGTLDRFITKKEKNRKLVAYSFNTSDSCNKKDEISFESDEEEKSSKKDKKRKYKEEDVSHSSKYDVTSEDLEKSPIRHVKKQKIVNEDSSDRDEKYRGSQVMEVTSNKKDKKRKYKELDTSDRSKGDSSSICLEETPSKRRKIKDELDISNSSENKADDEATDESSRTTRKAKKMRRPSRELILDHKDKYDTSKVNMADDFESGPEDPLPDVFENKRLGFYPDFISFTEDERTNYERHWIAYGGTVVKSIRSMDVDYVIHNDKRIDFKHMQKLKKKVPDHTRHVHKNWLIKCINECVLCDTAKFSVIVEPI